MQGTKSYLQVSSEIGILAIGVALLMISGEFDLSIGSLIGFSSMSVTLLTVEASLSMPVASILTLIMVIFIGPQIHWDLYLLMPQIFLKHRRL